MKEKTHLGNRLLSVLLTFLMLLSLLPSAALAKFFFAGSRSLGPPGGPFFWGKHRVVLVFHEAAPVMLESNISSITKI